MSYFFTYNIGEGLPSIKKQWFLCQFKDMWTFKSPLLNSLLVLPSWYAASISFSSVTRVPHSHGLRRRLLPAILRGAGRVRNLWKEDKRKRHGNPSWINACCPVSRSAWQAITCKESHSVVDERPGSSICASLLVVCRTDRDLTLLVFFLFSSPYRACLEDSFGLSFY